jgi:hypothetical protein
MKKLKLEDLVVDSFTTSGRHRALGTVRAHSGLETYDLTCGCTVGPCEVSDFGCGSGYHNTCSCGTCHHTCNDSCDVTHCINDPCDTDVDHTCYGTTRCC